MRNAFKDYIIYYYIQLFALYRSILTILKKSFCRNISPNKMYNIIIVKGHMSFQNSLLLLGRLHL